MTEVRLVEAAAQLFARNGFKATATREIALLADLNEATLFRYFPRKPDLFLAALESHLIRVKLGRELQASLAADEDPLVVVPGIVGFLLSSLMEQPTLQHLLHVATFELPEAQAMIQEYLGPVFDMLCGYFRRLQNRGAIRRIEPALATFGLVGVVAAHRAFRRLVPAVAGQASSAGQDAAAYVSLCLFGLMRPPEEVPLPEASPEPLRSL